MKLQCGNKDGDDSASSKTGSNLFEISDNDDNNSDSEPPADDEDDEMSMISLLICRRIDDNELVVVVVVGRVSEPSEEAEVMTMVHIEWDGCMFVVVERRMSKMEYHW